MNIKRFLGLPLYLKIKDSKIKKQCLIVNPAYDFTLYYVFRTSNNFALVMDENFRVKFISTQKYINVEYNFDLDIDILIQDKLENPDIDISEDFYNYFYNTITDLNESFSPSICLYEKRINNAFVILKPEDTSKGYWVDIELKIYVSNNKTKFKENIDTKDTRTVYSNFGTLKCSNKSKNLYLSMRRIFYVKKDVEVLTSGVKF